MVEGRARTHLVLMLVLTFTTGIIDAVGYLGLDRVFTANMTGNVVIRGMALAGADGLPVAGPALALLGFAGGAVVAGRLLRPGSGDRSPRLTVAFGLSGSATVALGVSVLVVAPQRGTVWALCVTAGLALATGLQAAPAPVGGGGRHDGGDHLDVDGSGGRLPVGGWSGDPGRASGLAVVLILVGASVGALSWRAGPAGLGLGLLVAGAMNVVVAARRHRTVRAQEVAA